MFMMTSTAPFPWAIQSIQCLSYAGGAVKHIGSLTLVQKDIYGKEILLRG